MIPKIIIIFSIIFFASMISPVFAHSAKVVGDFKIETGWKEEPPVEGISNAIEITVSLADEYDKATYDMIFFNKLDEFGEKATEVDLSGLEDTLESRISLGGEKTFLVLEEDPEHKGVYYASFTPESGIYTLYVYGVIQNFEFETSSQIESVTPNPEHGKKIPDWIRNNAKWYADGTIQESDFISGIEFMIKNSIIQISYNLNSSTEKLSTVPDWIKNNAKWWSEGQISDDDFVKGLQFLVEKGIIQI